jgi:hypothetical protein
VLLLLLLRVRETARSVGEGFVDDGTLAPLDCCKNFICCAAALVAAAPSVVIGCLGALLLRWVAPLVSLRRELARECTGRSAPEPAAAAAADAAVAAATTVAPMAEMRFAPRVGRILGEEGLLPGPSPPTAAACGELAALWLGLA